MLETWEIETAPDEYTPGTFEQEYALYLESLND